MIMNIENPDALRVWLSATLAPICDADPAALAKYVMALLKKDKSEQELKDFCVDQLDVFLQRETKPFVDKLFVVIKDRSYLISPAKPIISSSSTALETSPTLVPVPMPNIRKTPPTTTPTTAPVVVVESSSTSSRGGQQGRSASGSSRPGRSNSRSGRKRSSSPSGHRGTEHRLSRSRSKDRAPGTSSSRSDLRGGGGDRRHDQRQSKEQQKRETDKENRSSRSRKSPPPPTQQQPSSTGAGSSMEGGRGRANASLKGERGDSDGSPDSDKQDKKRRKPRCRDFDEKGFCMRGDLCPYDHGPDPVVVDDIALPAMISITSAGSAAKPPSTPGGTPNFAVPPPGYGTAPPSVHPPPPGMDAGPYQQAEGYNPEAPSISVAVPPPGYNRPPPPSSTSTPRHPPPIWAQQPPPNMYMSQPPTSTASGAPPLPVPLPVALPGMVGHRGGPPPTGRELITLDTAEGGVTRTVLAAPIPMPGMMPYRPQMGQKRPFGMGVGGPAMLGMQGGQRATTPYDKNNCTLEVRRIPSHLNTISKLNEHFSQFGQIVNMQVRYENDPEAALITFANRQQAVGAYKSTAPILNNRFIKIFWHDKEAAAEAAVSSTNNSMPIGKPSIKDRLGAPPGTVHAPAQIQAPISGAGDTSMKYRGPNQAVDEDGTHRSVLVSASGNLTRTIYNPEALAAAATQKAIEKSHSGSSDPSTPPSPASAFVQEAPPLPQSKPQFPPMIQHPKIGRKQQRLQEAMKKSLELQKAKSDLLKKQLEQQKLLLAQLEKCTNPAQKKEIIKTLKSSDKNIKSLSEDLSKQASMPKIRSKEALEREMLDTELELIRQRQAGGDTSDLQRRLTELRLELTALLARSLSLSSGSAAMDQKLLATSTPVQSLVGEGGQRQQQQQQPMMMKRRRAVPETSVLDKRPKNLSISGFQIDEKDALIEHLQHYGMLEDIEFQHSKNDHQACRATAVYKTRREAEMALANGGNFRNHQLTIQWAHLRTVSVSDSGGGGGTAGASSDAAPNVELTAEEILASLDDDDDEEEEEETEAEAEAEADEAEESESAGVE